MTEPASPLPTVALPPASSFIRALWAPLAGYVAALAAGAVLTGSVYLALALDGDLDSESGVDSSVLDGLLALIALPVQFAGMGLFGTLHFEDDGFQAGIFVLPLFVSAAFVVATYVVAQRTESADPTPGPVERAMLSFAGGLATAIVVTVATRLLALRDEDGDFHAASIGLFLGTLLLSTLTAFLARTRARTPGWPRWLAGDWRAAGRLWTHHLLTWMVVSGLILAVWVALDTSLAAAALVLIWGPTAALFGYSAGHLSGISVFDETAMGWEFDGPLFAALLVAALLLAVAASIAWSLRRSHDPAWLALPNSWLAVPAMFALGGFAVWLLPTIRLSGGIDEVGGALTIRPAPWVFLVLAAWGVVIEVGSRTVAPVLTERLPSRLRNLLAGPAVAAPADAPPTAAPVERRPLTPEESRRLKRLGIGLGAVVGIVGLGWLTVTIVNSQMFGPESAAEDYLDAIEDSDLTRAVELAPLDDSEYMEEADDALLDEDVYAAADERITGYEITDVETEGDTATVTVELAGLDAEEVELTLEKDGRTGFFFDEWKVTEGGLSSRLTLDVPDGSESLAVNGVEVSLESSSAEYWVFPGSYSFDPFLDNPWVEAADADPTVVAPDSDAWSNYADLPSGSASSEFMATVDAELESLITECMEATELEPAGCPQSAYSYGDDPRNVEWTLVTMPTLDYTYFDGTFPADLSSGVDGEARVSFEADESYGFGKPDYRPQTDTSSMYISATVTEVNGELVVEFDWY